MTRNQSPQMKTNRTLVMLTDVRFICVVGSSCSTCLLFRFVGLRESIDLRTYVLPYTGLIAF
ncbi:hypothetical protein FHS19_001189 [Paenibacillus rhizosphaerae]|uniref:Uncharacterized protein n=1 Tax=Paenibacillus rhizosphaerae TaxID=297318 RepID=A0A839TIA6_9BACL|nr:hypothetical protein [Paenibacillus rhizosphaerae]